VEPYAGKWVAIWNEKVVSSGTTLQDALTKIPEDIPQEESLLFKVPTKEEIP